MDPRELELLLATARILRALLTYLEEPTSTLKPRDANLLRRDLDSALEPFQPKSAKHLA
jgi:hypothetical protein